MEIPDDLHLLQKIKRVEAPPHLWPAIQRQLSGRYPPISTAWAWTAAAAAVLILCINMVVMVNVQKKYNLQEVQEIATTMHLSTSNDLYYE